MVDRFHIDMRSLRPDCVACTEAKHSEKPYGLAEKKQLKLGQLTHVFFFFFFFWFDFCASQGTEPHVALLV